MDKKHAKRTSRACDQCRRRKAKCDGQALCGACQRLSLHCSYGDPAKLLRGPAYIALLENKVEQLEVQLQKYQSSDSDHIQWVDDDGYIPDGPLSSAPTVEACLSDSGKGTSTRSSASETTSLCQLELNAACAIPHGDDMSLDGCSDKTSHHDSRTGSFASDAPLEVLSTMAYGDPDPDLQTATGTSDAGALHQILSSSHHSTGQRLNLDPSVTWSGAGIANVPPLLDMNSDALHFVPPIDSVPPGKQQIGPFFDLALKQLIADQQAEGTAAPTFEDIMIQPYYETPPPHQMTHSEILQVAPVEPSELQLKDLAPRHCNDEQMSSPESDVVSGERMSHHRRSRSAEARERNRLAATKCRVKKKVATNQLEKTAREMETLNRSLQQEVRQLRNERARLQELALDQKFVDRGTRDTVQHHHH